MAYMPVIANVNFGHVHPMATLPVGACVTITAAVDGCEIFVEHNE
jgi:muramoyltetrapeptide carboxypeptidase LdcA involved in peptidoglycan recycling